MIRKYLFVVTAFLIISAGCAGMKNKPSAVVKVAEVKQCKNINAETMEQNALEYFRSGGFYQASKHFKDAAEMYTSVEECKVEERRALVAAAKTHLWAGDKQEFKKTVEQVKGLLDKSEIPPLDIRLLINISDKMERRPLTYPFPPMYSDIFSE